MRDRGRIITGLAAFLAFALLPVWQSAFGGPATKPEPKIVTKAKQCVEPAATMRRDHMELLNTWRDAVVRDGQRTYMGADGKPVTMSLVGTCMRCHSNKSQFCDACHNYLAVSPYCWECHIEPKEKT
jgi:hypothetical protein